jgi:asparagine synthase (glutamine-hydrolysing)
MCGIVGLYHTRRDVEPEELARMSAQLVHRGPDDHGSFIDGRVGLAMRRLSIVDLPCGHQPMPNEDRRRWVVFNGEVYNFRDLRPELAARGHVFHSQGDTETILHAYEEFGRDCVHQFNGMFAFAVWDAPLRRLFAARDRLGVKPFYYYWDGETFVFASELKALLASGCVRREVEPNALWHYLTFRYVPAPLTIWRGVRKLPPGHRLTVDVESGTVEVERYWDVNYSVEPTPMTPDQELAAFTDLFNDAVRLRLLADVPVGVFLSGGLDSSAVVAAARVAHDGPVNTFAVAFEDGGNYDELAYARSTAAHVGATHHEVVIGREDFMRTLPDVMWHLDEPMADPACVPLFHLSQLARKQVKVVLSGEGADEILAGYDLDASAAAWRRIDRFHRIPRVLRHTLPEAVLRATGMDRQLARLRRGNVPLAEQNRARLEYMTNYFDEDEKLALWPELAGVADSRALVRGYFDRAGTQDPLHQVLYALSQDWLTEDLLMKADKMTMAHSLELRVPFLDFRLVEWLASRPSSSKVGDGRGQRFTTKRLLRRYAELRLPRAIVERPKLGFPVPIREWILGPMRARVRATILDDASRSATLLGGDSLRRVCDDEGHPKWAERMWLLFSLETWARQWL